MQAPENEKGVLVGCDEAQEWLLPWWWERYRLENTFPVAFADLGMTEEARKWCRQRGQLFSIEIEGSFIKSKAEIANETAQKWEKEQGEAVWTARQTWFKKPFVLLCSPYQTALWLDLDCEVLGPIDVLFTMHDPKNHISLLCEDEKAQRYNSGVLVFSQGCQIISTWAEKAIALNGSYKTDDALLSSLLADLSPPVTKLPRAYNWSPTWGINENALIYHWHGLQGKAWIRNYGGIRPFITSFLADTFKEQCHEKK